MTEFHLKMVDVFKTERTVKHANIHALTNTYAHAHTYTCIFYVQDIKLLKGLEAIKIKFLK